MRMPPEKRRCRACTWCLPVRLRFLSHAKVLQGMGIFGFNVKDFDREAAGKARRPTAFVLGPRSLQRSTGAYVKVEAGGRMARYRGALPQLGGALFLTDGGIETTLIFNEGLELPDFAAFDLLRRPGGRQALRKYFRAYADLAQRFETGLVLESATWRANSDWGARQDYGRQELA